MRRSTRLLLLPLVAPAVLAGAAYGADDEWSRCGPGLQLPQRPASDPVGSGGEPGTVLLSADEAEVLDDGSSKLSGNVMVEQGSRRLLSDALVHDPSDEVIEARGNVRFWDEGVFVAGERARATLADGTVAVEPAVEFMLEREHGHGGAAGVRAVGAERLTARDATYTTCNPGDPDWRITAEEVELDRVEDVGTARNLWLELGGQRVLYLPGISFPLSSRRKTGFLPPVYGTGESGGAEVTVPYYFNLAPNHDATLAARAMSERGVQARGELRFLSRTFGSGRLAAEHLPSDSKLDDSRTAFDLSHRHRWRDRLSTDARFEWVSDPAYLEDLGSSLSQSSQTHLPRRLDARYRGDGWDALVRFQDFLTVDTTVLPDDRPHARLPQVLVRTDRPARNRAASFGLTAETGYFDHDSRTTGARVDLQPSVTWPVRTAGTWLVPKATLSFTGYDLDRAGTEASGDDNPSRLLPTFSLDGGMSLERPVTPGGRAMVHTIEPRLYYLHVPFEDQDDLPRFDTTRPTFSFAQLFRENRFSGRDRIGDADQVALTVTSRLLDATGGELVRGSIGQIRYFRDREVTLFEGGAPETSRASDIVAEVETHPVPAWRLRAGVQYDTGADRTERGVVSARYQPDRRSVVNAAYRLVRDPDPDEDIEQVDLSFAWPVGAGWRTVGRWHFALDEERRRTLEAFGGLEYESCCWGFRVVARRFLSGGEDSYSNGVFLQLELKGLTGVGRRTGAFLTRSIPGYENEF